MRHHPLVEVIVLNWNGIADTLECLRSVVAADYPNFQVTVIDNASGGNEPARIRAEFPGATVIENPRNLGFAGGANVGLRHALESGADYALLLNNDTVVDAGFLTALIDAASTRPKLAAACPKTYFFDRRNIINTTGGEYSLWKGSARQVGRDERDTGQYERLARRGYADGVCMLIPRSALERVGLLDEEYFAYWEETDWCARAADVGLRCYYVPGARIWHKAERSRTPDNDFHYRYRRNALMFVRKRGNPLQFASALFWHFCVYGPRYFLRNPGKITRAPAELKAVFWHASNQPSEGPLVKAKKS
jgi:hypothetical protein